MAYARIEHGGGAITTTLSSGITSGDTSIPITASTAWPSGSTGPFYAVIDAGLSTEEKILATTRSGLTLTSCLRGVDGTSAAAHSAGATISHIFSAAEADEANALVKATLGTVAAKGDMIIATASATLGRLAVGANNLVHIADSAQTTGTKWGVVPVAGGGTGATTAAGALSALGLDADLPTFSVPASTTISAFGKTLVGQASATTTIAALGIDADIATFSLPASTTISAAGAALIDDASAAAQRGTLKVMFVCTSGTRPGAPADGDSIFETDTGKVLVYYATLTAWLPPWDTAWGEQKYVEITSPIDCDDTEKDVITGLTFTAYKNRAYAFHFNSQLQAINANGFWKAWLTTDVPANIRLFGQRDILTSGRDSVDGEVRVVGSTNGSVTYRVRGKYSTGSGSIRFNATGDTDPGPTWCSVRDVGPTDIPTA